ELPLMTWLLAAHGNQQVRTGSLIDRWRERHPLAAEVGLRLNSSQALREVATNGVEAVWSALAAELGSPEGCRARAGDARCPVRCGRYYMPRRVRTRVTKCGASPFKVISKSSTVRRGCP